MMSIQITVDGEIAEVDDGQNLLDILRKLGKRIPSLCHHPALKRPTGACRLCAVEIQMEDKPAKIRRACITKTKPGMVVRTNSEKIKASRSRAMNALLAYAPQSTVLSKLSEAFDLDTQPLPDDCIRCHLCHRICSEVVGAGALRVAHRDGHAFIVPVPGRCIGCGTCANVCPTDAIRVEDHDNVRSILIRDEIIGQHPLERCEGCGRMVATPKFLARIEARTIQNHPDKKDHHHYCPTCAKLHSDRIRRLSS